MKTSKIFLLGAMALAFTACEDDPDFYAPIQSNPQGPVYEVEGVTVEIPSETSINLGTYSSNKANVPVANLLVSDFPEDCTMKIVTYIAKDDTFDPVREVPCLLDNNTVYITPDNFQNAFVSFVSKSPAAKDIFIRFAVYAVKGNQTFRIGTENSYLGGYKLNVTPYPSDFKIEDNYYLLGTVNDWSIANALKFNHSDANPYDDPIFTIKVEITPSQAADGWWWKIVPESTYKVGSWVDGIDSQFGPEVNGCEDMEGILMGTRIVDGEKVDPGAGCIKQAGVYTLTINLEEGTFAFTSAVERLYTPGDTNGWSAADSQQLATNNYEDYFGYAHLSPNGFKFTSAPDWDHTNYGMGATEGTLSTDGGAGNLSVPANGLYWCQVNTDKLTYSLTEIKTLGIIGDATPAGWDASTALTPSADFLVWRGTMTLKDGQLKFRANDNWDVNLGGDSYQNLTPGGDNLNSPGAGTYQVTLNLSQIPYTCTFVKK